MAGITMDHTRYVPPLAASFSTLIGTNSETQTLTDTTGSGLRVGFGVSPAAGDNVRAALKAKAASTNYSIIARIQSNPGFLYQHWAAGLCVSDGTKLVVFGPGGSSPIGYKVSKWNSATSFSADALTTTNAPKFFEWLRIDVVAGDPSLFFVSDNGKDWIEILSSSMTAFLTYTKVGFFQFYNAFSGSTPVAGTQRMFSNVLYFSDPDIVPAV